MGVLNRNVQDRLRRVRVNGKRLILITQKRIYTTSRGTVRRTIYASRPTIQSLICSDTSNKRTNQLSHRFLPLTPRYFTRKITSQESTLPRHESCGIADHYATLTFPASKSPRLPISNGVETREGPAWQIDQQTTLGFATESLIVLKHPPMMENYK